MYALLFLLASASLFLPAAKASWAGLAVFGIALGGVIYSAYLTYLEVAVIHALCVWCVVSAATVTAILTTSAAALIQDGAPAD